MRQVAGGQMNMMEVEHTEPVSYCLPLGSEQIPLNGLLGQKVELRYNGTINCIHCNRKTSRSFNQGYCYPCFMKLAECDSCIVSPEKCHFHLGTCREPEWGLQHCMQPHIVYLANSSGLKVGITRASHVPTRWIDQGAVAALPVATAQNRYMSGLLEHIVRQHVSDRTNWQAMLKGASDEIDLAARWQELKPQIGDHVEELLQRHGLQAVDLSHAGELRRFSYPVLEYPVKVVALNLDKTPEVGGTLLGIKGQYLLFDSGVINIRKYGGYQVALWADAR